MKNLQGLFPPSALLIGAASLVSASSLASVMRGPGLWVGAALGVAVALVATAIWSHFKLMLLEWVAVSLALFIALGGIASGPVPSPSSYRAFVNGLIGGWADLLSSVPPVDANGEFAALPYALGWVAAMLGIALMRKVAVSIAGAAGPAIAFGVGLMFSVELRGIALAQGSLLVALSLALGWYQQRFLGFEVDEEIGNTTVARRRTRFVYAAGALALAAGLAPFLAPFAPGLEDRDRFDLRDRLVPPWNPLDEPSPLAQIKSNYLDDNREEVVFVASGDAVPRRWGLATLASFDGSVWTVGESDLGGVAQFVPIDSNTPQGEVRTFETRPAVDVTVEIVDLDGPWIPVPGRAMSFNASEELPSGAIRFNDRTGTAALPSGLSGFEYTVTAEPWHILDEEQLAAATYSAGGDLGLAQQAASVRDWSADVVAGADFGWPQIAAIRNDLRSGGYLADDQIQPGHSWARLNDFFSSEEFFGNEEQYAAVAGIAARNAGLEARIVVGYLIDESKLGSGSDEIPVVRSEATAWLEVFAEEFGWLPVDVTPDRDNEPTLEDAGFRTEAVAAPNPPPTIPSPPDQEVAPDEEVEEEEDDEEEQDEEQSSSGVPTAVLAGAVALGLPTTLLIGWVGAVAGLKAIRRKKRRNARDKSQRVAGAWYEAQDRLGEFGVTRTENASLHEFARHAESTLPSTVGVLELADLVDRSAFAAENPADSEIDEAAWSRSEALVSRVRRSKTRTERIRSLANPRALMKRGSR